MNHHHHRPIIFGLVALIHLLGLFRSGSCTYDIHWATGPIRLNVGTGTSLDSSPISLKNSNLVVGFSQFTLGNYRPFLRAFDRCGAPLGLLEVEAGFSEPTKNHFVSSLTALPTSTPFSLSTEDSHTRIDVQFNDSRLGLLLTAGLYTGDPDFGIYFRQFEFDSPDVFSPVGSELRVATDPMNDQLAGHMNLHMTKNLALVPGTDLGVFCYVSSATALDGSIVAITYRFSEGHLYEIAYPETDIFTTSYTEADVCIAPLLDNSGRVVITWATDYLGWYCYYQILNASDLTDVSSEFVYSFGEQCHETSVVAISSEFIAVGYITDSGVVVRVFNISEGFVERDTFSILGVVKDVAVTKLNIDNLFLLTYRLGNPVGSVNASVLQFDGFNTITQLASTTVEEPIDSAGYVSAVLNGPTVFFTWEGDGTHHRGGGLVATYGRVLFLDDGPPFLLEDASESVVVYQDGESTVLLATHFEVYYHLSNSIAVEVESVENIRFRRASQPMVTISRFSLSEVAAGEIVVEHFGGETALPGTSFRLVDVVLNASDVQNENEVEYSSCPHSLEFSFVLDDLALTLGNPTIDVTQGGMVLLGTADMRVERSTWPSRFDEMLIVVSEVEGGHFELIGEESSEFSMGNLAAGIVSFVTNGSGIPPSCSVYGKDPMDSEVSAVSPCSVDFQCVPVLVANNFQLDNSGDALELSDVVLGVIDCDSTPDQLVFDVLSVQNAKFVYRSEPTLPTSAFTQEDLNALDILLLPDSNDDSVGCRLEVIDELGHSIAFDCDITTPTDGGSILTYVGLGAGLGLTLLGVLLGLVTVIIIVVIVNLRQSEHARNLEGLETPMKATGGQQGSSFLGLDDVDDEESDNSDDGEMDVRFFQHKAMYKIPWTELTLIREIGSGGGSGRIFKAKWQTRVVAFKMFRTKSFLREQADFEEFQRELEVMSSVSHPNLLRFYGASLKRPRVGIVMEFLPGGDLETLIHRMSGGVREKLSLKQSVEILVGIASGLQYLHSRNVIHRDIKGANVLLTQQLVPKIIDFGLSKIVSRVNSAKHTKRVGTSFYIAPEVILGTKYDSSVDVFSFSILTYCLLGLKNHPYPPEERHSGCIEIKQAQDPEFRPNTEELEKTLPPFLIQLMQDCWKPDPSERPTCQAICDVLIEKMPDLDSFQPNVNGESDTVSQSSGSSSSISDDDEQSQ